jgi:hypothetical protein
MNYLMSENNTSGIGPPAIRDEYQIKNGLSGASGGDDGSDGKKIKRESPAVIVEISKEGLEALAESKKSVKIVSLENEQPDWIQKGINLIKKWFSSHPPKV